MAKTFLLEIITPKATIFKGFVEMVVVRTKSGEEGFMAGHSRATKLIDKGQVRIILKEGSETVTKKLIVTGGFVDVKGEVLIFVDDAKWENEPVFNQHKNTTFTKHTNETFPNNRE
jgi:F0F1-type ATP synthase epsilon subunit